MMVCILSLTSCYTPNALKKSLDNANCKNTDYLRLEFGAPGYVIDNGDIGTIWVYSDTYVRNNPGYIGDYGYYYLYTMPTSYSYEASNRFWVNKNGIIIKFS